MTTVGSIQYCKWQEKKSYFLAGLPDDTSKDTQTKKGLSLISQTTVIIGFPSITLSKTFSLTLSPS